MTRTTEFDSPAHPNLKGEVMIIVDGKQIESFIFNGGECHVKLPTVNCHRINIDVVAWLYNANDIMKLMMIISALRERQSDVEIKLIIPYFPYARQDRVCNPGEAHSLKVMCQLIRDQRVNGITIYDPHSKVTENFLSQSLLSSRKPEIEIITRMDILKRAVDIMPLQWWTLVSPDAGAEKETRLIAGETGCASVYCKKVRDTQTGDIIETHVPKVYADRKYLLIDDICDGGRTFNSISRKFQDQGVPKENLYLYVTHGIFSSGFEVLKHEFNHIYCYHRFPGVEDTDLLTVLNEQEKWNEF